MGFGSSPVDLDIVLSNADQLRQVLAKNEAGDVEPLYLFTNGDSVAGTVVVKHKGKKVEHMGIKVEFVGQIGEQKAK